MPTTLVIIWFSFLFVTGIAATTSNRSREKMLNWILSEFQELQARCANFIIDETSDNKMDLRNLIPLPLLIFRIQDNLDPDRLSMSSSLCPFYILSFNTIDQVKTFSTRFESYLNQKTGVFAIFIWSNVTSYPPDDESLFTFEFFRKVKRVLILRRLDSRRFWMISQIFTKYGKSHELNIWNGTDVLLPQTKLFPDRLRTFHGKRLRLTSFEFEPFFYYNTLPDGTVQYGGLEYEIIRALAHYLQFTYDKIENPTDGQKWGEETSNRTFTGLVGDIMFERTDIGFADVFIISSRTDRIDFTQAYDTQYVCFMLSKTPPLPQWRALALPLTVKTWIALLICFGVIVLFVFFYCSVKEAIQKGFSEFSVVEGIFFFFATFLDVSQPLMKKIRHNSIRFGFGCFLMSMIVVTIGYKGSLISVLTVPLRPPPINTIEDIANDPRPVGSFGNVFYSNMNQSIDPHLKKIVEKYVIYENFDTALKKTHNGQFIMAESNSYLDYAIRKNFTDEYGLTEMDIAKECYISFRVAFATVKNGLYTDRISDKINQLVESGIARKWIEDELDKVAHLSDNQEEQKVSSKALSIQNMQGPFLVWLFTISLSLITIGFELLKYYIIDKKLWK